MVLQLGFQPMIVRERWRLLLMHQKLLKILQRRVICFRCRRAKGAC